MGKDIQICNVYISHNGYIDIDLKNIFVQIDLKTCNDKYRHIDTDI